MYQNEHRPKRLNCIRVQEIKRLLRMSSPFSKRKGSGFLLSAVPYLITLSICPVFSKENHRPRMKNQ
jgi:hypothetical protein